MNDTVKALPCLRCGSNDIKCIGLEGDYSKDLYPYKMQCSNGHDWDEWCETEQEAIELWNARPPFLHICCDRCDEPLGVPGALIFGPPNEDSECQKIHICLSCWQSFKLLSSQWFTSDIKIKERRGLKGGNL